MTSESEEIPTPKYTVLFNGSKRTDGKPGRWRRFFLTESHALFFFNRMKLEGRSPTIRPFKQHSDLNLDKGFRQ